MFKNTDAFGTELKVGDKIAYTEKEYRTGPGLFIAYIAELDATDISHKVTRFEGVGPEFHDNTSFFVFKRRMVKL